MWRLWQRGSFAILIELSHMGVSIDRHRQYPLHIFLCTSGVLTSDIITRKLYGARECQYCPRLAEVPNNFYRLLRVLEIVQTTGRTLAELDIDEAAPLDFDFRCFFLHRPRADLYRRIDLRCEQMVERGLLQVGLKITCITVCAGIPEASHLRR